ncbi:MAG: class I SAM-dependent methyltransferase [Planctomycetes bacterium]|nr:class I SAM-dependent methyltransferase [Planctomycetota bacterium]
MLSYGRAPLAEVFLTEDALDRPEPVYPLDLTFCPQCCLVQLAEVVPPDLLYNDDYVYYSSVSPALVDHFARSARSIIASKNLGPRSRVVEVASNDGYMLQVFAERGIDVLGIDPARGPARAAERAGIPTECAFFELELARRLVAEHGCADVVLANNVLNLVPDPNDFVAAVHTLMKPDGLAVLEVPYVADLIDRCEFDTVFHQNVSYFSMIVLDRLFRRHGLQVNHVEKVPTFGGSLRVFVERTQRPAPAVGDLLAQEGRRGVDTMAYYQDFADRAAHVRRALRALLE